MSQIIELNHFRLWSLMDLLQVYADEYITIGQLIADLSGCLYHASVDTDHPLTEDDKHDLRHLFANLKDHCIKINLVVSVSLLSKAIIDFPQSHRELDILTNVVKEEIKSKMFLFIPSQRTKYYEWLLPGELQVYFPNSSKELIRAGKCYAKG